VGLLYLALLHFIKAAFDHCSGNHSTMLLWRT
jgi:hypothetical protein